MTTLLHQILLQARADGNKTAIVDQEAGITRTYSDLVRDSAALRTLFASTVGEPVLHGARVLNLLPQGYAWTVAQLALFSLSAINLPQPPPQPLGELKFVVENGGVEILLAAEPRAGRGAELELKHTFMLGLDGKALKYNDEVVAPVSEEKHASASVVALPTPKLEAGAMMLFTSGTTGRPKGVLSSHKAMAAQCKAMGEAWAWSSQDRLLHVLPLTHIHGVINCLAVPLWHGATIEFMPHRFSAPAIWQRILSPARDLSLLMAVPTIYTRLLNAFHALPASTQPLATAACTQFRLHVSGSAPLPSPLKRRWAEVTGQVLLERYGMTETGMILSNPYGEVAERRDGWVGSALPGVEVILWDEDRGVEVKGEGQGEVLVRGDSLFEHYHSLTSKTAEAFTPAGYFRTGDLAYRSFSPSNPSRAIYRLLGRSSSDIIKSGGEKISALEIERVLMSLPAIADATVMGVPDPEWGECVGAVLVVKGEWEGGEVGVAQVREWCRAELSAFKLPKKIRVYQSEIPRNAMGKVQKKELVKVAFPEEVATAAAAARREAEEEARVAAASAPTVGTESPAKSRPAVPSSLVPSAPMQWEGEDGSSGPVPLKQ